VIFLTPRTVPFLGFSLGSAEVAAQVAPSSAKRPSWDKGHYQAIV
jgi:hypothetical protein